jgi:transcriptional regulator with XRE-family HTH domain
VDIEDAYIGRRVREIRSWRRLSLTAVAGSAGLSPSSLSLIERGLRPVATRLVLESLAAAVQVSPVELTGAPYPPIGPVDADAHAAVRGVETVLSFVDLGVDPAGLGVVERTPWPELKQRVVHLNAVLRPEADYGAQGRVVPDLLLHLHAAYVRYPDQRREILVGLLHTYHCAAVLTKNLGFRGLPVLAARLAQRCAEELDRPEWLGFSVWLRGVAAGSQDRAAQYAAAVRGIDRLAGQRDPNAVQAAGMLHLNAALAAAARADADTTRTHLDEAVALARTLPEKRDNFAFLHFGLPNIGVWQVSLATELGEGDRVAELAKSVDPKALRAKARRATFYADLGRSLLTDRATVDTGVQALVTAERIAPQHVRTNVFVREAISDLLRRARREAGGRELRDLATRMGVAPTG